MATSHRNSGDIWIIQSKWNFKNKLTLLFLSSTLVPRGNMNNSIGVNVECDFDLWNSPWRGRDTNESELTQEFVVICHFTLTLVYLDFHLSLSVGRCGEHLTLLCRNGCVTSDQSCEDTAQGFDTCEKSFTLHSVLECSLRVLNVKQFWKAVLTQIDSCQPLVFREKISQASLLNCYFFRFIYIIMSTWHAFINHSPNARGSVLFH